MKSLATILFTLTIGLTLNAQMEKRASPLAEEKATVGETEITISYSRPSMKGREIYGGLVPFDKIWRTGANEATTFTCSKAIEINGKTLEAGTYALFTIPGKEYWTVILNSQAKQWGAYNYDEKKDVMRFKMKTTKIKETEMFTINIEENTVNFDWETTRASFNIN